jgi:hypothetical protein
MFLRNLLSPLWHIRRIAYDAGEWHCAISRQRELPDWLDQSIEARHPDLALAMMRAPLLKLRRLPRQAAQAFPQRPAS